MATKKKTAKKKHAAGSDAELQAIIERGKASAENAAATPGAPTAEERAWFAGLFEKHALGDVRYWHSDLVPAAERVLAWLRS